MYCGTVTKAAPILCLLLALQLLQAKALVTTTATIRNTQLVVTFAYGTWSGPFRNQLSLPAGKL